MASSGGGQSRPCGIQSGMTAPSNDAEDRIWLADWRAGDDRAGRKLYGRYGERVTSFFESKLSSDPQVIDLVMRTFQTVQKTPHAIQHSVRGFIFGVARNMLRVHIRLLIRDRERSEKLERAAEAGDLPMVDVDPIDPERALGERMERRLLTKSLRRLGLDDQVILEFSYWEDLGRVEIAHIFGVPEGTMAGRLAAARRRLAAKMAELSGSIALLESTSKDYATWLVELKEHIEGKQPRTPGAPDNPDDPESN